MFGRLERKRAAEPMSAINMTPLIDVMLVLLIIFMIAAPLMTAALQLELPPRGEAAQTAASSPLSLALDAQGQAWWNGERIAPEALRERLIALGRSQPEAELQLAIDQSLPYGRVAALLDQLQAAGLRRLAFAAGAPASAPR